MLRVRTLVHVLYLLLISLLLLASRVVLPWCHLIILLELLLLLLRLGLPVHLIAVLVKNDMTAAAVAHLMAHYIAVLHGVLGRHLRHLI